jgi:excisionase family DNA binding protein
MRRHELTVRDVAELLGVSPGTVRSWISRRQIKRTPTGGIDGPSLAAWMKRHPETPAQWAAKHRRLEPATTGNARNA